MSKVVVSREIAPLVWTEPASPNDDIRYDHVTAATPFGRFSIEWKSWKQFDSYSVHLDGSHVLEAFDLEDAKAKADEHWRNKIGACLASNQDPSDWLTLAHKLEELGQRYWKAAVRERGPGAVQWVHNSETGSMFVFTRGEYAEDLKEFVRTLPGGQESPAPFPGYPPVPEDRKMPALLDEAVNVFEAAACKQTYRMADGVRAVLELAARSNIAPTSPETVPKHKFDCLVEHCKRLDDDIAKTRRVADDVRLYQENAVWFWQGDNQDHLESLSCPVVIPAGELRELLRRE
jgi:hypothetical protein